MARSKILDQPRSATTSASKAKSLYRSFVEQKLSLHVLLFLFPRKSSARQSKMPSPVMSSSTLELDHSKDEKSSQDHERQTPSEDGEPSTNVDAHEETRDSQQQASSRESSSYYARGGPHHEFKTSLFSAPFLVHSLSTSFSIFGPHCFSVVQL
jgi:hypothetical protein